VNFCPSESELAAYLDGALDVREDARWRLHFGQCAKCRRVLSELRELMGLGPVDPGRECIEKCRALVAAGTVPARRPAPGYIN